MRLVAVAALALGVAAALLAQASADLFELDDIETQAEALQELERAKAAGWMLATDDDAKDHVVEAMSRGWFDLAEQLVQMSHEAAPNGTKVDVTASVHQTASKIRRRMQALMDVLAKKNSFSTGIAPAFEWSQSPDSLFLNVKFAHKLDTPATLGCRADNVTLGNKSLALDATCKAKRKRFRLNLNFLKGIDSDASTWNMVSVGRATFTVRKAQKGVWSRLLHTQKKPGNMHVWWAMRDKYEKENEEFIKQAAADAKEKKKAAQEAAKDAPAKTEGEEGDAAKAADAAAADADADKTAEPAPPPPPSPFELAKAELEKAARKARRAAEDESQARIRDVDNHARKRKREAAERARMDKAAAEAEAERERTTIRTELDAKKAELDASLEADIAKAAAEHGEVWPKPDDAAAPDAGGGEL